MKRALADHIITLAADLLPGGHREGQEWRAADTTGEPGSSLGVHLTGHKAGIWQDFATGQGGDTLDLVRAVHGVGIAEAMAWSLRWLGIKDAKAELPRRSPTPKRADPPTVGTSDRWQRPWRLASPIAATMAETYLWSRRLSFDDPVGRVLRFSPDRARKSPEGKLEHHPALLAALSDARTGEQCGIINIYLHADGHDRIRDPKGKTVTGRARGAVCMLSGFDEPTAGLIVCEGPETGVGTFQAELRPVWACGGAGTLAGFPVLSGLECLTICADADEPGKRAAEVVAARWRKAGGETVIVAPPIGDWADRR